MILRKNCRRAVNVLIGVKWAIVAVMLLWAAHEARADGLYVSPGGVSWHQDRAAGYNERNLGVSAMWKHSDDWAMSAGQYANSLHRRSYFAAVRWTPVGIGPVRAGLLGGMVTGYEANGGGPIPVVLPAAAISAGPVDVTLTGWPSMFGSGAGIAAQFAVRVW